MESLFSSIASVLQVLFFRPYGRFSLFSFIIAPSFKFVHIFIKIYLQKYTAFLGSAFYRPYVFKDTFCKTSLFFTHCIERAAARKTCAPRLFYNSFNRRKISLPNLYYFVLKKMVNSFSTWDGKSEQTGRQTKLLP